MLLGDSVKFILKYRSTLYYNRMTGIANKYGADTILSGAELIYMLLVPSAFEFDKEENEGSRETTWVVQN